MRARWIPVTWPRGTPSSPGRNARDFERVSLIEAMVPAWSVLFIVDPSLRPTGTALSHKRDAPPHTHLGHPSYTEIPGFDRPSRAVSPTPSLIAVALAKCGHSQSCMPSLLSGASDGLRHQSQQKRRESKQSPTTPASSSPGMSLTVAALLGLTALTCAL